MKVEGAQPQEVEKIETTVATRRSIGSSCQIHHPDATVSYPNAPDTNYCGPQLHSECPDFPLKLALRRHSCRCEGDGLTIPQDLLFRADTVIE